MISISRVPGRLVTSGVAMLVLGIVLPGLAAAQTSPPAWVGGISSGTWGTINKNRIADVDPAKDPALNPNYPGAAPWKANSGLEGVITAWNGGALASNLGSHGSLLIMGGGHNDYHGNEVYRFDIGSGVWSRVTDPYPGPYKWPYDSGRYPDGSPVAPHTYDGVEYHPGTNSLVLWGTVKDGVKSAGDSSVPGGQRVRRAFLLDVTTGKWRVSPVNSAVGANDGRVSAYDAAQDRVWIRAGSSQLGAFNPATNNGDGTFGAITTHSTRAYETGGAMEWVPKVDGNYPDGGLLVYTQPSGQSYNLGIWAHGAASPAATPVKLKTSGTPPSGSTSGMDTYHGWSWSEKRQALIYWRRGSGVYELKLVEGKWDTGTWRWTNLTSSGNSITPEGMVIDNGVYGRFRIVRFGDEEVGVVVNRTSGPVYAFRIPDAGGPSPVSVSLSANPRTIKAGSGTTLSWSTSNASSCTASGAWSGSRSVNGTLSVTSIAATSQFILDCTGTSGESRRASVQVTVEAAAPSGSSPSANRAPAISGSPATTVALGETYTFTPTASDPDGNTLTFSVDNLPAWASFDEGTGTVAGVPGDMDLGTTSGIVITASDGKLTKSLPSFGISVIAYGSYGGVLSWTAPTTNALGEPLTYLAGYRIYYGKESHNYSHMISIYGSSAASHYIDGLTEGAYYFAVSSFDIAHNESVTSDEIKVVLGLAGSAPSSGSNGGNSSGGGGSSSSGDNSTTGAGNAPASTNGSTDNNASAGSGGGSSVRPFDVLLLVVLSCVVIVRRRLRRRAAVNGSVSKEGVLRISGRALQERPAAHRVELFDGALSMTGMKSLGITAMAAGLLISGASHANDADFQARCKASGVLKCVGFDNSSELSPGVNLFPAWDGKTRGVADTQIKASGASSLRFEVPPYSAANTSGYSLWDMGKGFGPGSTFYVQFRQRFSPEMIDTRFKSDGFKQVIFHRTGSSCGQVELATQNVFNRGFPVMYTACGGRTLEDKLPGHDYRFQQGDYDCRYQSMPAGCALYRANQWMTFSYKVKIGAWDTATSEIEAWIGYQGEPQKKWIDQKAFVLRYGESASDTYSKVQLTPYQSKKDTSQNHATGYVWYDELIVSTQPIAGPNGLPSTPSTGSGSSPSTGAPQIPAPAPSKPPTSSVPNIKVPTVPPAPPADVQFQF